MELDLPQKRINVDLTKTEQTALKNQLYTAASQFYISEDDELSMSDHHALISLIILMRKAKQNDISEDCMGKFAYDQQGLYYYPTPLYFNCLKKYNNTPEELPFNAHDLHINKNLAQAFRVQHPYQSIQDINSRIASYPAYTHLIATLKKMYSYDTSTLCTCLYTSSATLSEGYLDYSEITDFDNFYSKAYTLQSFGYAAYISYDTSKYMKSHYHDNFIPDYDKVYNFINLIARIKAVENALDEKNIFSKILGYDPHKTWKGCFLRLQGLDYVDDSTKNKMALFYKLAEQYHRNRGHKKTPTGKQFEAYLSFKGLDIALTDKINAALFDENEYAFVAFQELVTNIKHILHPDNTDADLQEYVNRYHNEI
jgi:hypothetical protein